jgi:hypothetical protein
METGCEYIRRVSSSPFLFNDLHFPQILQLVFANDAFVREYDLLELLEVMRA